MSEFTANNIPALLEEYEAARQLGCESYHEGMCEVNLRIANSTGTTHTYDEVVRLQELVKHQSFAIQLQNALSKRLLELLSTGTI